jgi:hypothetical protein
MRPASESALQSARSCDCADTHKAVTGFGDSLHNGEDFFDSSGIYTHALYSAFYYNAILYQKAYTAARKLMM